MAVTNNKSKTTLVLVVSGDVKANGEYARKTIRFTTLRTTATDDAVYSLANDFASLLSSQLYEVRREDIGELVTV